MSRFTIHHESLYDLLSLSLSRFFSLSLSLSLLSLLDVPRAVALRWIPLCNTLDFAISPPKVDPGANPGNIHEENGKTSEFTMDSGTQKGGGGGVEVQTLSTFTINFCHRGPFNDSTPG